MVAIATKNNLKSSNYWSLLASRTLRPMQATNKIIVAFSGGKDSLAVLLMLLEMGVEPHQIELWHHLIDEPGKPSRFDWPCTEGYVRAVGKALGIDVRFSWKEGGFEGELFREDAVTSGVYFEDGNGKVQYLPPAAPASYCNNCRLYFVGDESKCRKCKKARDGFGTRLKYPMKTADLSKRWCSAYLKIMVCKRIFANDPRFSDGYFWLLSGERRQESTARAKYNEVEDHKSNNKNRKTHQWRGVIDWLEQDVWAIIERHRIMPHPCYYLGWGRCSCMCCIFGDKDQWASIRQLSPQMFGWHAANEKRFGLTIVQGESVTQQADRGNPFVADASQRMIELAMAKDYKENVLLRPKDEWLLPAGAYKRCGGPV